MEIEGSGQVTWDRRGDRIAFVSGRGPSSHEYARCADCLRPVRWTSVIELATGREVPNAGFLPDGKRYLLTWTYHPRPLNTAVANSALMIAAKFGMNVTLLCPTEDYLLDDRYMNIATRDAGANGGSVTVTHEIEAGYEGADIVYAKSWGALPYFGRWEEEKPIRDRYQGFIVDSAKMAMTNDAVVSHCLPMRRNVKMTDEVFDSPNCMAYEEAENRLHVQKAIMTTLIGQ